MYKEHTKNTAVIYLDEYGRTPLVVTDAVYSQIQELVQQHRACRTCGDLYDAQNPRVSQNLCRCCYQTQYTGYRYLGRQHPEQNDGPHLFQDGDGKVFRSSNGDDDKPDENEELTLKHYGYPVPVVYDEQGREVYTNTTIYGVLGYPYIVVRLIDRIDREWFFLCDRTGKAQAFSRRDKRYQTAKKENLATTEKYSSERGDHTILRRIADWANNEAV